jgi:hypothetical protein
MLDILAVVLNQRGGKAGKDLAKLRDDLCADKVPNTLLLFVVRVVADLELILV